MKATDPKPLPPAPHECCGGGSCCPCVWDTYFEELRRWKAARGEVEESKPKTSSDTDTRYR